MSPTQIHVHRIVRESVLILLVNCFLLATGPQIASPGEPGDEILAIRQNTVDRGVLFLRTAQNRDGSFSSDVETSKFEPALSAIAITALLKNGVSIDDAQVVTGLQYLHGFIREDGGFYAVDSKQRNYETCLVSMCFSAARERSNAATARTYRQLLDRAAEFLKHYQWDEGEKVSSADAAYGGAGYGSHERPDLSNTSFMVDALHELGTSANDEAIQRALIFISRCQNLPSEHNQTPFASKISDGGFYYTPAAGGNSQAGTDDNGGLRSYASMTYAGLRSMIHAGLGPADPRVLAARKWLEEHYSMGENPGLGEQGLYYYYHTLAKTMAVCDEPKFVDKTGTRHDWKRDLVQELSKRQRNDGAWVNRHPRWLEENPVLVTSYALLALSYCEF